MSALEIFGLVGGLVGGFSAAGMKYKPGNASAGRFAGVNLPE